MAESDDVYGSLAPGRQSREPSLQTSASPDEQASATCRSEQGPARTVPNRYQQQGQRSESAGCNQTRSGQRRGRGLPRIFGVKQRLLVHRGPLGLKPGPQQSPSWVGNDRMRQNLPRTEGSKRLPIAPSIGLERRRLRLREDIRRAVALPVADPRPVVSSRPATSVLRVMRPCHCNWSRGRFRLCEACRLPPRLLPLRLVETVALKNPKSLLEKTEAIT